jgi:hypothetical protein
MKSLFEPPLTESPLLRSRLGCLALVVLLQFGIGLRVRNLDISTGRSPDETNYTAQAARLLHEGNAGLRGIADDYLRDPAARLAGPPTRAGYLWLLAATMRITGRTDETAGAILSCAASIGSLLLVALIGIRFFPPTATLFALLFLAVSPPELELARRCWADALVGFLGLAVVYAAAEITRDSQRRLWHGLFILFGTIGMLVKEFGAVIFALCAAWVVGVMILRRKQYRDASLITAAGVACALLCLVYLAWAVGGFAVFWQIVADWRGAHLANQYALEFQSGPPSLLLRAFYVVSPVAGLLLIAGLFIQAVTHWFGERLGHAHDTHIIRWIALFFAAYLAIPMLLPNWLNLRYVSVLFGPFYLLAGVGFWYLADLTWRHTKGLARTTVALTLLAGVTVSAAGDLQRFKKIFVNDGVGDLSVKLILDRADLFSAEKRVKRAPTAENYLTLCWRYEQNWRYKDSIAACQNALAKRPDYAEAYDQLAVAHVDLEQWSDAAAASARALELNPTLPRAKVNLERATRQVAGQ